MGRLDRSEKYGLNYMLSWDRKHVWEAEGFGRGTIFQVSSREGVQRIVGRVVEIVEKYGEPFLRGDLAFYNALEKLNRQASAEYTVARCSKMFVLGAIGLVSQRLRTVCEVISALPFRPQQN